MNGTIQELKTQHLNIHLHNGISTINITNNLCVHKITNWMHTKEVPPNHRLVVNFLSTKIHPKAEAMSPQGVLALSFVHSPLLLVQNIGSTSTTVPIH